MYIFFFCFLYSIGGIVYYLLLRKARTSNIKLFGLEFSPFSIQLLLCGEVIWISCWIIGSLFYNNFLTYILGGLPLLIFFKTIRSILVLIYKNHGDHRQTRKNARNLVRPIIQDWAKQLPKNYKLYSTNTSIKEYGNIYNGRVIVLISGEDNNELEWEYYGDLLKQQLNQPVIMEIRLNDEIVYPTWK
ncbi:hypothetical protein PMSD_20700 [Paenibacillus macquariensis subsp. defensor]|nr:hypothetical protein PMSD_20700 [Paenibacillus macquariensis subsp. defensor]